MMDTENFQRLQRRTVASLAIAQVFSGIGTGSALALGSLMAEEITGSTALAGTSTLAFSLSGALLGLPLAQFAQRYGRRTALTVGLSLASVGAVLMILAPLWGFATLLLGAFLIGLGNAANLQARFAATDLAAADRQGRDLSVVMWSVTIGAVAGPNLIGWGSTLGSSLGLPPLSGPFLYSLAGLILGTLILQFGLRPDPLLTARKLREAGELSKGGSKPPKRNFAAGMRTILANPDALLALVAATIGHFVMVAVMAMTPVYMRGAAATHDHAALPDTLQLIGLTISLHIAGMYALSPVMGWLADKWGPRQTILLGHGVLLAATVFAGFGRNSDASLIVGLILLGLGWSASMVAASALMGEAVAADLRPTAQGSLDSLMNFAGVAAAGLSGGLMVLTGYLGLNLISGAMSLVVLAMVVWSLRRVGHDPRVSATTGGAEASH